MKRTARRNALITGIVGMAAVGSVVGFTAVASAHTGSLKGIASCADGTYTVDWTLTTTNVPSGETATVGGVSALPAGSSVTGLKPIKGNTTEGGIVQINVDGAAHSATLKLHLHWTADQFELTVQGSVQLSGNCVAPPPPTTTTTAPPPTTTTAPPSTTTTAPPSTTTTAPPATSTTVPAPTTSTTEPPHNQVSAPPAPAPSVARVAPPSVPDYQQVNRPATTPGSIQLPTGATSGDG